MDGSIKTGPSVLHRARLTKTLSAHQLMAAAMRHATTAGAFTVKFSQSGKTFQSLIVLKPFTQGLKDDQPASRRERQVASSHHERKPKPVVGTQQQNAAPPLVAGGDVEMKDATTPKAQRQPKPQPTAASQSSPKKPQMTKKKPQMTLSVVCSPNTPPQPTPKPPQPPTSKPLPIPPPPSIPWAKTGSESGSAVTSQSSDDNVQQATVQQAAVTPVYHFMGDMHTHTDFPPLGPQPNTTRAQKWRAATVRWNSERRK